MDAETKVVVLVDEEPPVMLVTDLEALEAPLAAEELMEETADESAEPEREADALAMADDAPDVMPAMTDEASLRIELGRPVTPPTTDVTPLMIELT